MARWEPNARERLERAALALFTEHGFDATTVAEIADRAGLTKSTFFRHFADKREVLFGGQDMLVHLFSDAIRTAPPAATTADCLAAALEIRRRRVHPGPPRSRPATTSGHRGQQRTAGTRAAQAGPLRLGHGRRPARTRSRRHNRAPGRRGRRSRLQHRLRALGGAGQPAAIHRDRARGAARPASQRNIPRRRRRRPGLARFPRRRAPSAVPASVMAGYQGPSAVLRQIG